MNEDDSLSKKLAEVEERKNNNLARQVESADRGRIPRPGRDEEVPIESHENPTHPGSEEQAGAGLGSPVPPPGHPRTLETDYDHPERRHLLAEMECVDGTRVAN